MFTTFDLERVYYQFPVAEEDIPKTVVTTLFGLFEFLVPFGFKNATQIFRHFMDAVFQEMDVDDILAASDNFSIVNIYLLCLNAFGNIVSPSILVNAKLDVLKLSFSVTQ